jgi:hypothetical protein
VRTVELPCVVAVARPRVDIYIGALSFRPSVVIGSASMQCQTVVSMQCQTAMQFLHTWRSTPLLELKHRGCKWSGRQCGTPMQALFTVRALSTHHSRERFTASAQAQLPGPGRSKSGQALNMRKPRCEACFPYRQPEPTFRAQ